MPTTKRNPSISQGHRSPATSTRARRRSLATAVVAGATLAALVVAPTSARAEEVSPTVKGIAGGALLGGEIVTFGEAIFGVRSPAAYIVGAAAGAAAGGVGGYFIEQSVDDGRAPAYMLAGGFVLLIPAIVVALDQTRYMPEEGARQDRPSSAPPADPGQPNGSAVVGAGASTAPATPAPATTAPATPPEGAAPATPPPSGGSSGGTQQHVQAPLSLVNVQEGNFYLGVPVPEVRPAFSAAQAQKLAVQNNVSEVRFPIVHVQF